MVKHTGRRRTVALEAVRPLPTPPEVRGEGIPRVNVATLGRTPPTARAVNVTGTLSGGAAFVGQLSHVSASVVDGELTLFATLVGPDLPGDGARLTAPVRQMTATRGCTVLSVVVGPSHLTKTGSRIGLSTIDLDVSSVPGSGSLRGNPLCAGWPDGGGSLQGIAALFNRLVSGLRL